VGEGNVRILIDGGWQTRRVTVVHRVRVRVSSVCDPRGWRYLVIITPVHRHPRIRRLGRSREHGARSTMIPPKLHLGLLRGVRGDGPTCPMAIYRWLGATARAIKLLPLPIMLGSAISTVHLFVAGDVLPHITRTATHDWDVIVLTKGRLDRKGRGILLTWLRVCFRQTSQFSSQSLC